MPLRRLLATILVLVLFAGCGPKGEEEPIWIGCVAALSDQSAGAAVKQGAALAVDAAAGQRVEGRRLSVIVADDHASDDATQAEAVRLLAVNHVAGLIGGLDPGRALRLARAAQPYNAPVILPGDVAGPPPGDAVFSLGVRPGWRGAVLARYASGVLKAKHAFVLTDQRNSIAVELSAGFVQAWPSSDGSTLDQAAFQSDADLPASAGRAASAKPDVVLIAAGVSTFGQAAGSLRADASHPALLYGGEDVGVGPLAAGRGDCAIATVVAIGELTDRGKEFAKKYQERFHEAPDLPACQGYDAARFLFDAMARAKGTAADHVRDQLKTASDGESLTGPLHFKDGQAVRRVFVVALQDGQGKVVQAVDAEPDSPPTK
ncbi:MAG TPA: ABC transporter substrate-binding protein [Gemmataceae bacterium]|nr:ABC transporter substrate-binding protein [Gemmataceae bacterium]